MNNKAILVYEDTNKPAKVGDALTDFRGDTAVLESWKEPYDVLDNPYRGAKVYVSSPGCGNQNQYYPSVFGLKFIPIIPSKVWDDAAQRSV